jgi:hypothetical protein
MFELPADSYSRQTAHCMQNARLLVSALAACDVFSIFYAMVVAAVRVLRVHDLLAPALAADRAGSVHAADLVKLQHTQHSTKKKYYIHLSCAGVVAGVKKIYFCRKHERSARAQNPGEWESRNDSCT